MEKETVSGMIVNFTTDAIVVYAVVPRDTPRSLLRSYDSPEKFVDDATSQGNKINFISVPPLSSSQKDLENVVLDEMALTIKILKGE